jgi:hypothetical protein
MPRLLVSRAEGRGQGCDGVSLIVVFRFEAALTDGSNHRLLAGIALAVRKTLDGSNRHSLVGDPIWNRRVAFAMGTESRLP